MKITWDQHKREVNLDLRGLDFAMLTPTFFEQAKVVPAKGDRFLAFGVIESRTFAVVFKPLGSEAISVISLRREPQRKTSAMRKPRASGASKQRDTGANHRQRSYTDADVAEVMDHAEATDEQLAGLRPFAEVFPELAASIRRSRGPQKAPTKQQISLRLDREVIERFKAEGPGWQVRMGEALKRAAGL